MSISRPKHASTSLPLWKVIREIRLVEGDRLDDARPGGEHDPDVLALRSERGRAEHSRSADGQQRRGIALTARFELIQRLAELGRDIDTGDLAIDREVAGALETCVLLGD